MENTHLRNSTKKIGGSTIKNRLKVIRADRDLTQEQLAEMVGVSRATIHAAETGKSIPNGYTMFQIAKALGVSVTDIFVEEEGK